jgi:hypothetical protein
MINICEQTRLSSAGMLDRGFLQTLNCKRTKHANLKFYLCVIECSIIMHITLLCNNKRVKVIIYYLFLHFTSLSTTKCINIVTGCLIFTK